MTTFTKDLESRRYNTEKLHEEFIEAKVPGFAGIGTSGNRIWAIFLSGTPNTPELDEATADVCSKHDPKMLTDQQKRIMGSHSQAAKKGATPKDKLISALELRHGDPLAEALLEYFNSEK